MEDKIDPRWRKSSYSGNGGGDCVEVGNEAGRVLVRDTKDSQGPKLAMTADAWKWFVDELKAS